MSLHKCSLRSNENGPSRCLYQPVESTVALLSLDQQHSANH